MSSYMQAGHLARVEFELNGTDLPANTSQELISPVDGYIQSMDAICQGAITTGGTITMRNWTTGSAVTVQDLSLTFPNSAAKGSKPTVNVAAKKGHDSLKVKKGDRIVVFPASFATAGAVRGSVYISALDSGGASLGS